MRLFKKAILKYKILRVKFISSFGLWGFWVYLRLFQSFYMRILLLQSEPFSRLAFNVFLNATPHLLAVFLAHQTCKKLNVLIKILTILFLILLLLLSCRL